MIIAITYILIYISNYLFDWLNFEFVRDLSNWDIFKIRGEKGHGPKLTWGLARLNGILFIIYWVVWWENKIEKKPDFYSNFFKLGLTPIGFAFLVYFLIGYRNDLVFAVTGSYEILNLVWYISYKIRAKQKSRV